MLSLYVVVLSVDVALLGGSSLSLEFISEIGQKMSDDDAKIQITVLSERKMLRAGL